MADRKTLHSTFPNTTWRQTNRKQTIQRPRSLIRTIPESKPQQRGSGRFPTGSSREKPFWCGKHDYHPSETCIAMDRGKKVSYVVLFCFMAVCCLSLHNDHVLCDSLLSWYYWDLLSGACRHQPIQTVFNFLKNEKRVQIWLYEDKDMRINGQIMVCLPVEGGKCCDSQCS